MDTVRRTECDLKPTWFELLQLLARRTGCRIPDVAEDLVITEGGTSGVVDRVEAAGYCARRVNPDERRSFGCAPERRVGSVVPEGEPAQFTETLAMFRAAGHALT
ncbi:MarR family transcriptional regulator [Streptomyces sp. NPDC055103]